VLPVITLFLLDKPLNVLNNKFKKGGTPMAPKVSNNKININEKVISIGIDVHKASWRLTAVI
jgi:hypothetical protein